MIFSDPDIEFRVQLHAASQDDWCYVTVFTEASTKERAKQAASEIASLFTEGRETFWRVTPESDEQKDFMHNTIVRPGYARFSFRLSPGKHHFSASYDDGKKRYVGLRYSGLAETIVDPEPKEAGA
jgi:hypothetical protein